MKTKICSRCKIENQISNFHKKRITKDGLSPWCKPCCSETMFAIRHKDINHTREKANEYRKRNIDRIRFLDNSRHRIVSPEKRSEYRKRRRAEISIMQEKSRLKKLYGLTFLGLDEMRRKQFNMCAICGRKLKLNIDHCHKTGKVRELLCFKCNTGLGMFGDNLRLVESAARYLRKHSTKPVEQLPLLAVA
jgi:hypothetical protein